MKILLMLSLVILSSSASASQSRKCVLVGVTPQCGDASALVKCEGYDQAVHLANHQKIISLSVGYRTDADIFTELATLKQPQSPFGSYTVSLGWYQNQILAKTLSEVGLSYQLSTNEIIQALEVSGKMPPEDKYLEMGEIEISRDSPVYRSCQISNGEADRSRR